MFPSLCQILKALCCRRRCCCCLDKPRVQTCSAAALGDYPDYGGCAKHRTWTWKNKHSDGDFSSLGAAYWLGAVFIITGIMTILAGRFPSSCLVGFTVFMNIVGAIFSITGIVLYAVDLRNSSLLWICDRFTEDPDHHDDNCKKVAVYDQGLLTALDRTLILLAVLLLVVSICFTIQGIRFLVGEEKEEEVDNIPEEDVKEIILITPGA